MNLWKADFSPDPNILERLGVGDLRALKVRMGDCADAVWTGGNYYCCELKLVAAAP